MLLILSHGQASVERGFSVNGHMLQDNMREKCIVSQRLILDYLTNVGGSSNVVVSPALLASATTARQRYHSYLEENRQSSAEQKRADKRKLEQDEVEELVKKKKRLEEDIAALQSSADSYAEKAEKNQPINTVGSVKWPQKGCQGKRVRIKEFEYSSEKQKQLQCI